MINGDSPDKSKVIDFEEKRKNLAARDRLRTKLNKKAQKQEPKKSGPGWLAYIQFFLLLLLVAWLMRQCQML
jgi:hypothetical protein